MAEKVDRGRIFVLETIGVLLSSSLSHISKVFCTIVTCIVMVVSIFLSIVCVELKFREDIGEVDSGLTDN